MTCNQRTKAHLPPAHVSLLPFQLFLKRLFLGSRGCRGQGLPEPAANPRVLRSPHLASVPFVFFGKAIVFVLFPSLLWGNAAASEMKHQLLSALKDFQVGQTALQQEQALRVNTWG